jgi:NAD-reducing hydrogenase large subunit
VSRVEGHGKVTILLDDDNKVHQVRLHIVEFRGFEKFIQGRPYWEVPVMVQRLCGICPVSHHLGRLQGAGHDGRRKQLTPTAEKMRRLMHYGQILQSHALHFFHLSSPDLLFGFDERRRRAQHRRRGAAHPEIAKKACCCASTARSDPHDGRQARARHRLGPRRREQVALGRRARRAAAR